MFSKNKANAIDGKNTLKYYWQEIRKYKTSFFVSAVSIPLASVILDTIVPYYLSSVIGLISSGDVTQSNNQLVRVGILAAIGVSFNLLAYQTVIRHEAKVRSGIAHSVLDKLLKKDHNFFANQKIGALTGKFIDFINSHVEMQDLFLGSIARFIVNIGLGIFLIWQKAPILALIVIALVVGLLVQVKISRRLRNGLRQQRKELVSEANGLAADIITNNVTVKTFASEDSELAMLDDINLKYRKAYTRDLRWTSVEGSTRILVMQIIQIVAIFIIGGLLVNKQIQLDIAIFTIVYLQRLSTQLFELGEILFGYDKIMLRATPMTEILMDPPKIIDKASAELVVKNGSIKFNKVFYAYEDCKDQLVLKNFCLEISAGQKVGLVGPSGAGKTTVTRLLLRFDDLNSGQILIDGKDISKVTQSSLRRSISYVPQEPLLFHRSLRENIAYGNQQASDHDIIEATKLANAYEFINKLPNGMDTIVGERGVKLSGGQRQRIAIARAILKNAPILILDEATSALDSESESMIQKSLNTLMANRTSLVVAHRLSTIARLDRIIILDEGRVVEDGSHKELIAKNGLYAQLWNRQSGGFIDEDLMD